MWSWLSSNSDVMNVIFNGAMLLVWLAYFQLLYITFRKQNQSNILINRGAGEDLESRCLVANMSSGPVYVQAVKVELTVGQRSFGRVVSDTQKLQEGKSARMAVEETAQGPIAQGDMLDLGSFYRLGEMVLETAEDDDVPASIRDFDALSVSVFAVYAVRNDLVGATRRFRIERRGEAAILVPTTAMARQESGWFYRRRVEAQYPRGRTG